MEAIPIPYMPYRNKILSSPFTIHHSFFVFRQLSTINFQLL